MYWSDWGSLPKIESATLSGEHRYELINTDLGKPMGLTIDYADDMLYWVDDWLDTVNRMDIETGNRYTFPVDALRVDSGQHSHLFGISVYKVGLILKLNHYLIEPFRVICLW